MLHYNEGVPPVWKTNYQHHLQDLTLGRLRVVFPLVIFITVLDGGFQLFLKPAVFYDLVWVRTATISLCILFLGLTYVKAASRSAFALLLFGILIIMIDIEAAIIATGGYHSSYQTGLSLLIVAVGLLFPFPLTQMCVACISVWFVYLGPVIIGEQIIVSDNSQFFMNAFFLICASAIAMSASYVTSRLRKQEFFSRQALKEEQAKSEQLLLNVLPSPIANRLKDGEEPISDSFDEVTVLFADIVGFTPFSEKLLPTDLITILNELFSRFDGLSEKYGLEKIKTIGDAYMVVGGIPLPKNNHAEAVAEMALGMVEEIACFNMHAGKPLDIRIGVSTGPVVAGVIGQKKFIYDLWGDTVNTASRMESHGVAGKIHMAETTYNRLSKKYEFEKRGVIHIKGKGEMRTYFLKRRKIDTFVKIGQAETCQPMRKN